MRERFDIVRESEALSGRIAEVSVVAKRCSQTCVVPKGTLVIRFVDTKETVELITLIAENHKKRERPIHRDGVLLEAIELFTRLVQLAVES